MAGRRLVDVAKLFTASKAIAAKHIALRSQQLDVYTRTSSLAKAVKSQTDRVTLTAQAAIALAKRVNEEGPARRSDYEYQSRSREGTAESPAKNELNVRQKEAEHGPLPDGTIASDGVGLGRDGVNEDTFSERSTQVPPKKPLEEDPSGTQQGVGGGIRPVASQASTIPNPFHRPHLSPDAARNLQRQYEKQIPASEEVIQPPPPTEKEASLTDGHDRDVFYVRSKEEPPEPSSLPRRKIPKHTENEQPSVVQIGDGKLNQDVFYATPKPTEESTVEPIPSTIAVPEQEQVPEGINTDVFRTKRVAKLLGADRYAPKPHLNLQGAGNTPRDQTKLAEGHDQDTFNVRKSEQTAPSAPEQSQTRTPSTTEEEMRDLASELAKDAAAAPSEASQVRPSTSRGTSPYADVLTARHRSPEPLLPGHKKPRMS